MSENQKKKKTPKELALEWEQTYGDMSSIEYKDTVGKGLASKLGAYRAMKKPTEDNTPVMAYPQIVKTLSEARVTIAKLSSVPEQLMDAKRKALNEEFDTELKKEDVKYRGALELRRGDWVNTRLREYLKTDKEYLQKKEELDRALYLFSMCSELKEKWEAENADIIEAEKIRSRRAELMQADPETLKALGITPDPVYTDPHTTATKKVDREDEEGVDPNWFKVEPSYLDAVAKARVEKKLAEQKRLADASKEAELESGEE